MTEGTNSQNSPSSLQEENSRWKIFKKWTENPIIEREIKSRMRGWQGFGLLTAYLILVSIVIAGMYFYEKPTNNNFLSPGTLQELGKKIFESVVVFELALITFIGPALTSGAISGERERKTFDLLRTSTLSSQSIVVGKLGAAVSYLLLLVFAALPLQSLSFFMGGVGWEEMFASIIILATTAVLFCTIGLYFSNLSSRTNTATILSYLALVLPVVAPFGIFYVLVSNDYLDFNSLSLEAQSSLFFIIWISVSTNPFTAAYITELMLIEEHSLFVVYTPSPPFLVLFSPWIIYVLFTVIMTFLMIRLIVFHLDRYGR